MSYLDETILQSRTTLTLVEFIKKLWKHADKQIITKSTIDHDARHKHLKLEEEYYVIIEKADKAKNKRSIKI